MLHFFPPSGVTGHPRVSRIIILGCHGWPSGVTNATGRRPSPTLPAFPARLHGARCVLRSGNARVHNRSVFSFWGIAERSLWHTGAAEGGWGRRDSDRCGGGRAAGSRPHSPLLFHSDDWPGCMMNGLGGAGHKWAPGRLAVPRLRGRRGKVQGGGRATVCGGPAAAGLPGSPHGLSRPHFSPWGLAWVHVGAPEGVRAAN